MSESKELSVQKSSESSSGSNDVPTGKNRSRFTLWLMIAISLLLSFGIYLGAWQAWQYYQGVDQKLQQLVARETSADKELRELRHRMDSDLARIDTRTDKLSELLSSLDKQALFNTKQLNSLHGSDRSDWLLAEAEYLLRLANQRLNMERDVHGAEAILKAADRVLVESQDPGLYPVRKQIADELLSLQSVKDADKEGIFLKLEAVINTIEMLNQKLSLKEKVEKLPAQVIDDTSEQASLENMWQQMLGLFKNAIQIRRLDQPVEPLLAPEQDYYLKQNLRLMLEQAEVALLRGHESLYHKSLGKAEHWLATYFMQTDKRVQLVSRQLAELKKVETAPELPNISGSLKLLKDRVEDFYRQHKMPTTSGSTQQGGQS